MGSTGGFPVDLILFGMIAVFLVLRLRSILGRRTGFERPSEPFQAPQDPFNPAAPPNAGAPGTGPSTAPPGAPHGIPGRPGAPVIDGRVIPLRPDVMVPHAASLAPSRPLPDPASPVGLALARMQAADHGFTPAGFLDGAERAFGMIVTAFAAGDRVRLHGLLTEDTYRVFKQSIAAREAVNHVQETEIRAIPSATIETAELLGSHANVTVRFVSDQVSITRDNTGHPVAGTESVTEITDMWTFERDLASPDPVWRLVAARSA